MRFVPRLEQLESRLTPSPLHHHPHRHRRPPGVHEAWVRALPAYTDTLEGVAWGLRGTPRDLLVWSDSASLSLDQQDRVLDALGRVNALGTGVRLFATADPAAAQVTVDGTDPTPGEQGHTEYVLAASGYLALAHVRLSPREPWFAGWWTPPARPGVPGQLDFASVVTHEIGHALGLGHDRAWYPGGLSVMFPGLTLNTARRDFSPNDVRLLHLLYG